MIGGTIQEYACVLDTAKSIGQGLARGVKNGRVEKTCGARRRRLPAPAFPRIQADVVMIPACREKGCLLTVALSDAESEHACVKLKGTHQIRHLQMDVAYTGLGRKRFWSHPHTLRINGEL